MSAISTDHENHTHTWLTPASRDGVDGASALDSGFAFIGIGIGTEAGSARGGGGRRRDRGGVRGGTPVEPEWDSARELRAPASGPDARPGPAFVSRAISSSMGPAASGRSASVRYAEALKSSSVLDRRRQCLSSSSSSSTSCVFAPRDSRCTNRGV